MNDDTRKKIQEGNAKIARARKRAEKGLTSDNARVFVVDSSRMPAFEEKFEALAKRAKRLAVDAPTMTEIESFGCHVQYGDAAVFAVVSTVVVEGPEVKLPGGWRFVATIDHMTDTPDVEGNLVKAVPGSGVELPVEYRTAKPTCDHCGTMRYRKETFVVANAAGMLVRVGRTCLKDFLGHGAPRTIAASLNYVVNFVDELGEPSEWAGYGGRAPSAWDILGFLALVAYLVRCDGWTSRGQAREMDDWGRTRTATADDALAIVDAMPGSEAAREADRVLAQVTDRDRTTAQAAVEWARTQGEVSDYMHNLRVACSVDYVTRKTAGLVASAVAGHARHIERELAKKRQAEIKADAWLGDEGDKFGRKLTAADKRKGVSAYPAIKATVLAIRYIEGRSYGYGQQNETTIVKLVTDEGQLVTWFATNYEPDFDRGDTVKVVGTVKRLNTYQGKRETVLTRCVITKA